MADPRPAPATRNQALARVRLRHLQCLIAVADAGNLRRAAELLAVSQPAVTKTLNELEALLGVKLVVRGRRGAVATPEAAAFLKHAQASVAALGEAVDSVLSNPAEQPLKVGLLPTVAPSVMPRVLARWRIERPHGPLRAVTGLNRGLLQALRARELDVVIGRLSEPEDMLGLTFELLYAEPLVVAAPPGHAALQAKAVAMAIAESPLVLPLAGTLIRHAADGFLSAHGIVPRGPVTEAVSAALGRALALEGALWFAPLSAAEADVAAGRLVRLPVDTRGTEEPVGLLLRADEPLSPALRAFIAAVRAEAAARRRAAADAAR